MTTLADANVATTRTDIRRQVSDLLGDLTVCSATATSFATTFIDVDHLTGPNNAFAGREMYVSGGTIANLGKKRFVTSSTTSGVITFVALPSATVVGDEIELRNLRNQGWSVDEIHRAINTALGDADNGFWSPSVLTLTTLFDDANPTLTIPNSFSHLYGVEYQDECGGWHDIDLTHESDEPGWRVLRGQRVLAISGFWAGGANGRTIRLSGYKRFAPLTDDSDTTGVNPEWLRYQTASYLLLQGRERLGDGSRGQLYLTYQSRADRLRDLIGGAPANNTVAVL